MRKPASYVFFSCSRVPSSAYLCLTVWYSFRGVIAAAWGRTHFPRGMASAAVTPGNGRLRPQPPFSGKITLGQSTFSWTSLGLHMMPGWCLWCPFLGIIGLVTWGWDLIPGLLLEIYSDLKTKKRSRRKYRFVGRWSCRQHR